LIKPGENKLTAKITCHNERNPNADAFRLMSASAAPLNSSPPLTKWHTVNVTGVAGAPSVSSMASPSPLAENTDDLIGEVDEVEDSEDEEIGFEDVDVEAEGSNNDGIYEDSSEDDSDSSNEGVGDSFFGGDPFF
jgi:hypothetical protein